MRKFKMLVVTDHTNHSKENSLYPLVSAMRLHPRCVQIDVASRGNELNDFFFKKHIAKGLFVRKADEGFGFHPEGKFFKRELRRATILEYDVVWLRMPPPLSKAFLFFLKKQYPTQLFINDPDGIYETGSKKFLMNFQELCPPMKICESVESIIEFKNQFPIVLKPYRDYGGNGIVKIDGNWVWRGMIKTPFDQWIQKLDENPVEYLGVKFLEKVSEGDKRIVVIDGQIMGASLRLPAKDSWLCNVAQGGRSGYAEVDEDEQKIIERIDPVLSEMGIVMYGVDTLLGDEGKRMLSEINTTSIGGLPQIANLTEKPLLQQAADLFWNYVTEKNYGKSTIQT